MIQRHETRQTEELGVVSKPTDLKHMAMQSNQYSPAEERCLAVLAGTESPDYLRAMGRELVELERVRAEPRLESLVLLCRAGLNTDDYDCLSALLGGVAQLSPEFGAAVLYAATFNADDSLAGNVLAKLMQFNTALAGKRVQEILAHSQNEDLKTTAAEVRKELDELAAPGESAAAVENLGMTLAVALYDEKVEARKQVAHALINSNRLAGLCILGAFTDDRSAEMRSFGITELNTHCRPAALRIAQTLQTDADPAVRSAAAAIAR